AVFQRGVLEVTDHLVDVILEGRDLPGRLDLDRSRQVALGDRRGDLRDGADLGGQVGGELVDVIGQVLPGAGHALDIGLAAQNAFGADLAGHARYFRGKRAELVYHRVDDVLDLQNLAAHVHRDFLRQVAGSNGGGDLGHVTQLDGQVAG